MQVGFDSPLVEGGDSDRKLSERRPVLPSNVAHKAPVRGEVVESAQHHLLRHLNRDIDLCTSDSLAKTGENWTQIREMRPKAELVVDRRLIGETDAEFSDRPEQYADVTAECFIPRLEREAAIRHTRKNIVNLRLKQETSD